MQYPYSSEKLAGNILKWRPYNVLKNLALPYLSAELAM